MTRHYLHLLIFLTLNLLCVSVSFGQDEDNLQNDNTQEDATWAQDLIEEYIQSNELGEEFDYNTFVDQLHYFFKHKLDLNYASFDDMNDLGLLSDIQINNIIEYRNNVGKLIVIYELQAIPTIDMTTIKRILPFVKVGGDLNDYQISIAKMMYKGKNDVFLRGRRYLEKQKGFLPVENPSDNHYLGDPYQFYARFKHTYENKLSYGITAEKDPGEEFFKGSNKQGFDFYSAHFFVKDYRKWLKAVAVGDFLVNMGQGLIHYDGFGSGKSAYVINIKKSGRTLQAFSSINEFNYQRGIGVTIAPIKNIEVTAFASIRKRDGNIVALTDTSDYEENVIVFTSLGISGLHRTALEIADEGAITQQSYGAVIKFKKNNLRINSNSLFENLSKPFNRAEQPYNQYQFSGTSILNTSIDYSYIYRNINFFGETALNFNNMSVASINGLIIGLDRKVDLAILNRYLPNDYVALTPNVFAETSQGNNENGTYIGIDLKPNRSWKWSNYVDFWKHPWLRFNIDAPSQGFEYLSRVTFTIKRRLEMYAQYKFEQKQYNQSGNETVFNQLIDIKRNNFRIQINNKLNKQIELRNRIEFSIYKNGDNALEHGFMIYQDIIYKPLSYPLSFTGRLAIFDTESYNTRIYAYENDLLNVFSVPPYYNQGVRAYLNIRYRGIKNVTAEVRMSQTWYNNQTTFGSALDLIQDNKRTEVKAQIKYTF